MTGDDVDVSRIVPSVRDLVQGISTRRRGLTLVPFLDALDPDGAVRDVARLVGTARAFATDAEGALLATLARDASDVPMLLTRSVRTARDCQRARGSGADGVCVPLAHDVDLANLVLSARSMRMAPLVTVESDLESAARVAGAARAWLLHRFDPELVTQAAELDRRRLLVVDASREPSLSPERLRALLGLVDAVVVPPSVHRMPSYAELEAELEG